MGLSGKLDEDTIANRFKRFEMQQTSEFNELIGTFSRKVHKKLGTKTETPDFDSSVRTVYGNQEGAAKGFNPKNIGKKSYHPLFVFLNSTKECLLSWLRPGDAYTANNSAGFAKQAFAMLHRVKNIFVRGDSGFFNNAFIEVIEENNASYLIKVKLKNLKKAMDSQKWRKVRGKAGLEQADFYYKYKDWKKERRFTAIRKIKKEVTEEVLIPYIEYEYFCYATNRAESPYQLHLLYAKRGECENWIESVKNQLFAGCMLTDDFWANEALWLCSILAYNLSVWMRKLTDKKTWHEEHMTFRLWFIQLAGKLVSTGRQVYLKIYKAYHYKEKWKKIDMRLNALTFT